MSERAELLEEIERLKTTASTKADVERLAALMKDTDGMVAVHAASAMLDLAFGEPEEAE